jgi:hypothetical protein
MHKIHRFIRSNFVAYLGLAIAAIAFYNHGLFAAFMYLTVFALMRANSVDLREPGDAHLRGRVNDYFEQCLPTFAETPNSSGTTLTRYTTHALTPEEFVADGISEDLRAVYANRAGAIMRGYRPNMMDMVLFGRMRDYSMHLERKKRGYQSIIQPFVTLPKEDVVNVGAFILTAGEAADEDYEWTWTVENGPADFQNPDLPAIDTQFVAGDTLLVFFTAPDGSSQYKNVEVVSSADATYGGTPAATLVVKAPYNQAQWDALSGAEQALWQPTGGLVLFSGNSTSNYRARCVQKGFYNPNSMAHYWFQTFKKTFQWTDEYERVNNAETMSDFFKGYLRLPLAKQIQLQDADYMTEVANAVMWGQPYAGQNVETWQTAGNLPVVYDLDGTTVMDVETRLKGYETQLDECGRVIDLSGAALNLDQIKQLLPIVARNRAGTGAAKDQVWKIDMLVSPLMGGLIKRVMATDYKNSFGVQYVENLKPGTNDLLAANGVWNNTYHLDDVNVTLNVISGFFLEDMQSMTPTAHKAATNYALFPDFSDVDLFVMEAKSRNVEYPSRTVPINETKCMLKYNVRTIRMESETLGLAVKTPSRHLFVKGFANSCPILSASACASYAS